MAKVQYGGGVTALTGSIGGWSFQTNRSGTIVRVRGGTLKNSTPKQTIAHQLVTSAHQAWQQTTAENKADWNTFADAHTRTDRYGTVKTISAFNWFSSINYYRILVGETLLSTPPAFTLPTAVQDYNYAVRSYDILLNFAPDFNPADNALLIFTTPFTSRTTTSQRQNMRLTKVIATGPYSFIDLTSDWETTHGMSWPPSDFNICGYVGIMVQTIKKSSGISSTALIKINGTTTDQEGIGFMSIGNDFIVKSLYPYEPEAFALFDRMTVEPTTKRKQLINNLIKGLKDDGNWAKLDVLVITADKASQSSLLDWKGLQDGALVNAPAFEIDRGYTSDGATSYINSQYNPSTDAVVLSRNDASVFVYLRNNIGLNKVDLGLRDVANDGTLINARSIGNDFSVLINSDTGNTKTNNNSKGLFSAKRIVNNLEQSLINGVLHQAEADNSIALINGNIYILAENRIGVGVQLFSTRQNACYGFGNGSIDHLEVYNRLQTYFTGIGANV